MEADYREQTFSFTRIIYLSVGIVPDAVHEPLKPKIKYQSHEGEGTEILARLFGVEKADFELSGGKGAAAEEITTIAHAGTHVDAPWHYAPTSEGRPARKIDELPVEWFFSDGVVLDFRRKGPGERIETEDLRGALEKIDYSLKFLDIVMLMTGRDEHLGSPDYFLQPGLTRSSTLWLVERGVKVIGIDAYSLDRNFQAMGAVTAAEATRRPRRLLGGRTMRASGEMAVISGSVVLPSYARGASWSARVAISPRLHGSQVCANRGSAKQFQWFGRRVQEHAILWMRILQKWVNDEVRRATSFDR